ncbi:hypothetical protein [Adonisia turfae]|uniref:Uncharacterized protein n=1 Tax=Adonisia turfae CCMR0081 TaxID=2292702 RepID=A0A6M0RUU1_9CYAN|nr:hypothetical protein [Adonisia turfae]NEZ59998.1 hypothetical protein [Adonisia turfae CCMR0081]
MPLQKYVVHALLASGAVLVCPSAVLAANSYRIIETQGNVWAQYPGQNHFQIVRTGMQFPAYTLLKTGPNSHAQIGCPGSSVWTLRANRTSGIEAECLEHASDEVIRIGLQTDNLLGGINSEIPYVTSPRRTSILGLALTLRWNPVEDASGYIVRVMESGNEEIWIEQVTGSEVKYSGEPLTPGKSYRVIVEVIDGLSSQLDEGADESDFELLYPEHVARVNTEIAKIKEQNLPTNMQALELAYLYMEENLLSEAIDVLESVTSTADSNSEVFQVLGDLYRYVGLNLLALSSYEQAISIATQQQSILGQANAKSGLAEIKVLLGELDKALQLLTEAQQAYDELGNADRSEELQERLDVLSP